MIVERTHTTKCRRFEWLAPVIAFSMSAPFERHKRVEKKDKKWIFYAGCCVRDFVGTKGKTFMSRDRAPARAILFFYRQRNKA